MTALQYRCLPRPLSVLLSKAALVVLMLAAFWSVPTRAAVDWVTGVGTAEPRVQLYFFWSQGCPHCRNARPFVEGLGKQLGWLELHSHELTASRDNIARYIDMAGELGHEARSVPAFFVCGEMLTGYDNPDGIGARIRALAERCRPGPVRGGGVQAATLTADAGSDPGSEVAAAPVLSVPLLGEIDTRGMSLPLFTLVIALLDAFNPCAFFVLLFLLSLMVHARSRPRMLLVGGTFVFFSGLVYFLFMAAWLNLFLVIGSAPWVTLIAGLVALVIGALNVKDYFLFKQGPSLVIPESAKPGLFRRMRGLISSESLWTMMIGTVALALAANSYELLCTAGFPMVYTRVLTLNALSGWDYYAWLALYNLIYVLPLLAIVLVFTFTLGARKLSERQGRGLKLLSGTMVPRRLKKSIDTARKRADLVVFTPHWGENWTENASEERIQLARAIVDEGVDAILGHSSHQLHGIEIYRGKPIVYDMGSLFFDTIRQNRMRLSAAAAPTLAAAKDVGR